MEDQNSTYKQVVSKDSPLKDWIINYVGEQESPENEEVTVEMVIGTMVKEFPEIILALAEENFLRGYEQAFTDMQSVTQDMVAKQEEKQDEDG
jgi:hypothetical protein